ncbi:MAG: universal stress protein [Cyclobacteriaceae bacterium]
MNHIQNILVAVPASIAYQQVVHYAIQMAQDLQAKLTIALIYTSNLELRGEEPKDRLTLARQKAYVQKSFEELRSHHLADASLEYRMVSIDGPLCDAILATASVYHPDLIVTAAEPHVPLQLLEQFIPYPLLLVPLGVTYHPVKHIGVAYDATARPRHEPIHFVSQLAQAYGADVEMVNFEEEETPLYTNRAKVELDFMLKDVAHRFHHACSDRNPVENIDLYTKKHPVDLLVVLSFKQMPGQLAASKLSTEKISEYATIPVLKLTW